MNESSSRRSVERARAVFSARVGPRDLVLSITWSLWEFMSLKHKVPQGYSPADKNAGLAYAFRDDDIIKAGKYQTDPLPKFSTVEGFCKLPNLPNSLNLAFLSSSRAGFARR